MRSGVLLVLSIAAVVSIRAVPPATAAESVNLAGNWALNAWLSDSGEQIAQELRADLGTPDQSDLFGGPEQGRPEGRSRMGGRGGGRPPETRRPDDHPRVAAEDQKRIQSLVDWIQVPPATLTIAQAEGSVTITDPIHGSRTFPANGQKQKQAFESGTIDSTTRWEGPQLVTDYDVGHGVSLRFSYMIAPPSNALLLRISMIMSGNQAAPFTIRLVYDHAS